LQKKLSCKTVEIKRYPTGREFSFESLTNQHGNGTSNARGINYSASLLIFTATHQIWVTVTLLGEICAREQYTIKTLPETGHLYR